MADIYIKVDNKTHVVTFVHKRPFDPINGMGLSREELSKTGFFVNEYPEPAPRVGKRAVPYYDHEQKKIYYEYIPTPFTTKARIDMIEQATNDMLLMFATMAGGMASPYTVVSNTSPINNSTATKIATMATVDKTKIASIPNQANGKIEDDVSTISNAYSLDDEDSKSTNSSESASEGFASGIISYLASQIYIGRMDKNLVFAVYPLFKDQIQKQLDKWELNN